MTTHHIYLAPHFDDAILSCGGTIHQQTNHGEQVTVVTICAGAPMLPLSNFSEQMHERWYNPVDLIATRIREDVAATKRLNAAYHHLDIPDCLYRGYQLAPNENEIVWFYTSDPDLFGPVKAADKPLTAKIVRQVQTYLEPIETDIILYAPLSVGHHVDHQLTQWAGWELHQQGYTVCFYEDYPYTDPDYPFSETSHHPDEIYRLPYCVEQIQQEQNVKLSPQVQSFKEADLQAKIESVCCYNSQLGVLFAGPQEVEQRLQKYARSVGYVVSPIKTQLAERFWWPQ